MNKTTLTKMSRIERLFLSVLLILFFFIPSLYSGVGGGAYIGRAATETVVSAYESSNVLDDLDGAIIGEKEFDLADYPFNEKGKPEIISFIEFGYSYQTSKQSDYGLYVYVYNPQGLAFDTSSARNKIEFAYGEKENYENYPLKFINYSTNAGYEGIFYKFKVNLTTAQRNAILEGVSQNNRVYEVSGITLSVKSVLTEYTVALVYKYSGYALGYGSELMTESTLECTVDGMELYLSLDVKPTYYRPDGTNGYKSSTQDTLHSVYFSVPNEIISECGDMTAVHATWLNARTAPILVTGNSSVYNELLKYIGQNIGTYSLNVGYGVVSNYSSSDVMGAGGVGHYGDIGYNFVVEAGYGFNAITNRLEQLNYIFYADNGNADEYCLSSEKILDWLSKYTSNYGGNLVNEKYSTALFDEVDNEFTEETVQATKEYSLTSVTTSQNWWQRIWGTSTSTTQTIYNINAIQSVTLSDMDNALNETAFCNKFYVAESDYQNLYTYVKAANAKDETVYLFRYYQSPYYSSEVTEFQTESGLLNNYSNKIDTNGYFAQEWVQLDFDIIDVTFTKDDVVTVIPVIMSPMDIVSEVTPPVNSIQDKDNNEWRKTLKIILGILIVILLIALLYPIVKPILEPILKKIAELIITVISFPFKLIGKLFKKE